jgi:hypothetical protein
MASRMLNPTEHCDTAVLHFSYPHLARADMPQAAHLHRDSATQLLAWHRLQACVWLAPAWAAGLLLSTLGALRACLTPGKVHKSSRALEQQQQATDHSSSKQLPTYRQTARRLSSSSAKSADSSMAQGSSNSSSPLLRALAHVWPLLAYYASFLAALATVLWRLATGQYVALRLLLDLCGLLLALLLCVCMWPPLQALLPRVETQQGWRVLLLPPTGASGARAGAAGGPVTGERHAQS